MSSTPDITISLVNTNNRELLDDPRVARDGRLDPADASQSSSTRS